MSFKYDSFMYAEFIDSKICDNIIQWYNESGDEYKYEGMFYELNKKVVRREKKESTELSISHDYYGYPFGDYRKALQEVLNNYMLKYPIVAKMNKFNIHSSYNFQYYPPGGGYKVAHSENSGIPIDVSRTLVFMTYLNDVPNGGTYFTAQDITVEAEKGKTLIWPAYFTHEHVGIITNTHEKMILTGWYEFSSIKTMLKTYHDLKRIMEEIE